jgi:hypothetical protein
LEKEVKNSCHLSVKVEEEQKEAKEVAALSNAQIVVQWYRAIRQREILDVFHLLSLN